MKGFNTNPYANPQVKEDETYNIFNLAISFHEKLQYKPLCKSTSKER